MFIESYQGRRLYREVSFDHSLPPLKNVERRVGGCREEGVGEVERELRGCYPLTQAVILAQCTDLT